MNKQKMTINEAIDELILHVGFLIEEIRNHEEYEEDEQGEFQIQSYENNKKEVEAFLTIFKELDPNLSTIEALEERYEKVSEARYGEREEQEVSEVEKELFEILNPWYKEETKNNGGYATEFNLNEEENKILAKLNMEGGHSRAVMDDEPMEPSEDDTFGFYPYRGEVTVSYNDYCDSEFSSFPQAFQEKALELIKNKLSEK